MAPRIWPKFLAGVVVRWCLAWLTWYKLARRQGLKCEKRFRLSPLNQQLLKQLSYGWARRRDITSPTSGRVWLTTRPLQLANGFKVMFLTHIFGEGSMGHSARNFQRWWSGNHHCKFAHWKVCVACACCSVWSWCLVRWSYALGLWQCAALHGQLDQKASRWIWTRLRLKSRQPVWRAWHARAVGKV